MKDAGVDTSKLNRASKAHELMGRIRAQAMNKYGSIVTTFKTYADCHDDEATSGLLRPHQISVMFKALFGEDLKETDLIILCEALDPNDTGTIGFKDFAPAEYEMIQGFKSFLLECFPDIRNAWIHGVALDMLEPKERVQKCLVVRLYAADFARNVKHMMTEGEKVFHGDLHEVFALLNWKGNGIVLEQLDHAACTAERTAELPQGQRPRHQNAHLPALHVKTISERKKDTIETLLSARAVEGDASFQGLRTVLTKRYGNITTAWMNICSEAGAGVSVGSQNLTFGHFAAWLRREKFVFDVKKLWLEAGLESIDDVMTYSSFAPESAELVKEFKSFLARKCSSIIQAWTEHFDPMGHGSVDFPEFRRVMMKELHYEGDAAIANMFSTFDFMQTGHVGLEHIDAAAFQTWLQTMDAEAGILSTLPTGTGTANPFEDLGPDHQEATRSQMHLAPSQIRLKRRLLGQCSDYASFCTALEEKYGNKIRAWACMGWLASDKITKKAFIELCKDEGLVREMKKVNQIWREATLDGTGYWSLSKFAPEEVRVLSAFKAKIERWAKKNPNKFNLGARNSVFKSRQHIIMGMWKAIFDKHGLGALNESMFYDAMDRFYEKWGGVEAPEIEKLRTVGELFDLLDVRLTGVITLRDIDSNAYQLLQEEARLDFFERLDKHNQYNPDTVDFATVAVKSVPQLQEDLKSNFGTLLRTWYALGFARNDHVTKKMLEEALRKIGLTGNIGPLVAAIDHRQYGYITINDFAEPEVNELRQCRQHLIATNDSVLEGWCNSCDFGRNGEVGQAEFAKASATNKVAQHLYQLFNLLDVELKGSASLRVLDEATFEKLMRERSQVSGNDMQELPRRTALLRGMEELKHGPPKMTAGERKRKEELARKKTEKLKLESPTDHAGMLALLQQKYGSIIRAWLSFGVGKKGRLQKEDFQDIMRREGFAGDLEELWIASIGQENKSREDIRKDYDSSVILAKYQSHDLDQEERNMTLKKRAPQLQTVSVDQFAPKAGLLLRQMQTMLGQKYGALAEAWVKLLDPKGQGYVDKAAFVKALEREFTELKGNDQAAQMFELLDSTGSGFITLCEVDPAAYAEFVRSGLTQPVSQQSVQDKTSRSYRVAQLHSKMRVKEIEMRDQEFRDKQTAPKTKEELLDQLNTKFGNLVLAYKSYGGEIAGDKSMFKSDFVRMARSMNYSGSIEDLWRSFVPKGKAKLALEWWDTESHDLLDNFRELLLQKYGSILNAWLKFIDPERSFVIGRSRFTSTLMSIGYSEDDAVKIFSCLGQDHDGLLTLKEFDHNAHRSYIAGDHAMYDEERVRAKELSHQNRHWNERTIEAHAESQVRIRNANTVKEAWMRKDSRAYTLEEYRALLRKNYGTLCRAFYKMAGGRERSQLSFARFSLHARYLGFAGNITKIWQEMDDNLSGIVDLVEFAGDEGLMIKDFHEFLNDRFGSLRDAWKNALDVEHTGVMNKDLFVTVMARNGYKHNASVLFNLLDVHEHNNISLYDIDPETYFITLDKSYDTLNEMGQKLGEQQIPHSSKRSTQLRIDALYRKEQRQQSVDRERDATQRPTDFDGFMVQLYRKYRNPPHAFQHLFGFSERVTFFDFCTSVRKLIGYSGDMLELWKELGGPPEKAGLLSLEEVVPEEYAEVKALRQFMAEKHGSFKEAWFAKVVQSREHLNVRRDPWIRALDQMGYDNRLAARVFDFFDADQEGCVDLARLEGHTYDNDMIVLNREEEEILRDEAAMGDDAGVEKTSGWRYRERRAHNLRLRQEHIEKNDPIKQGRIDRTFEPEDFTKSLKRRYRSLATAFFVMSDTELNMTAAHFIQRTREQGYAGKVEVLWKYFNPRGYHMIQLDEFDPEDGAEIVGLIQWLIKEYGSMRQAWVKILSKGKNSIEVNQFCDQLAGAGAPVTSDTAAHIFRCLDIDRSGLLTLEEFSKHAENDRAAGWHEFDKLGVEDHHFLDTYELHSLRKSMSPMRDFLVGEDGPAKPRHRPINPTDRQERFVGLPRWFAYKDDPKTPDGKKEYHSTEDRVRHEQQVAEDLIMDATAEGKQILEGKRKEVITVKEKVKKGINRLKMGTSMKTSYADKTRTQEDLTAKKFANTPMNELHRVLENRYGNITNGFFTISDSRLAITFEDFARGLKIIGFHCDPSRMWKVLDMGARHGQELLTLTQFHPKAAAMMNHFRRWLIQQFGDMKKAWAAILKKLEISGNEFTKISKYRFISVIESLGFPGDCEFVYQCLDYEDAGSVTYEELDWMTKDPILAHREETTQHKPSGGKKQPRQRMSRRKTFDSNVDFNQFRSVLEQKYGNLIRCWYKWGKAAGNDHTTETMHWNEFATRMIEEGFQEKLEPNGMTWDALNVGKRANMVHIEEFAPATTETLTEWMKFLVTRFGSLKIAWKQIVAKVGGEPVGKYQFCAAMEAFGFEGNSPAVFGILDVDSVGRIASDWVKSMPHFKSVF
jgi:Ca2+-binding EF-hand superfamily protein